MVPGIGAKETAKLMAWGLGPDWQAANASAPISNIVNAVRRGMFVAPNPNQSKVKGILQLRHWVVKRRSLVSARQPGRNVVITSSKHTTRQHFKSIMSVLPCSDQKLDASPKCRQQP